MHECQMIHPWFTELFKHGATSFFSSNRYLLQGIGFIGGKRVDTERGWQGNLGISNRRKPLFGLEGNGGDSITDSRNEGHQVEAPSGNWDCGKR